MRVRQQSADDGDYVFGRPGNFLVNSPEAVAQIIGTRLRLWVGEWFLDKNEGTPWMTKVVGKGTSPLYDQALRERILGTPGVVSISDYSSRLDRATRKLSVSARIVTQFEATPLEVFDREPPRIFAWDLDTAQYAGWEQGYWTI